jgi:hypothetical protein
MSALLRCCDNLAVMRIILIYNTLLKNKFQSLSATASRTNIVNSGVYYAYYIFRLLNDTALTLFQPVKILQLLTRPSGYKIYPPLVSGVYRYLVRTICRGANGLMEALSVEIDRSCLFHPYIFPSQCNTILLVTLIFIHDMFRQYAVIIRCPRYAKVFTALLVSILKLK